MAVLRGAARRFALLLAGVAVGTAAVSLVVGLIAGSTVQRSVSLGYYLVGSFLLVAGFFIGNRGRRGRRGATTRAERWRACSACPSGGRRLRWATAEERDEAMANSAVFVVLGFVLILLGVLVDDRARLFEKPTRESS